MGEHAGKQALQALLTAGSESLRGLSIARFGQGVLDPYITIRFPAHTAQPYSSVPLESIRLAGPRLTVCRGGGLGLVLLHTALAFQAKA